ncbi:hypothetical protein BB560_002511, partial [Smittium megazygosporum]
SSFSKTLTSWAKNVYVWMVFGIMVCLYLAYVPTPDKNKMPVLEKPLELEFWPQVFGYISAILYSGSRIPQIMKNYRQKSCEGLSLMMFVFTLVSNITYVLAFLLESTEYNLLLSIILMLAPFTYNHSS